MKLNGANFDSINDRVVLYYNKNTYYINSLGQIKYEYYNYNHYVTTTLVTDPVITKNIIRDVVNIDHCIARSFLRERKINQFLLG